MAAFLKIDDCKTCHRALPWEWVPTVLLAGKTLAGTGVWRSQLSDGLCPACQAPAETARQKKEHAVAVRRELAQLLGGEKPFREFTFEHYRAMPGNRLAFERSRQFDPSTENLYLWGPCGVGKTHLAWAVARRCFEETLSVAILRAWQLSRKVRMRDPEQEQAAIDQFVNSAILVLDDLGAGANTAFNSQILEEILDGRDFNDRAGLIITSRYSLDDLAVKLGEDSIPSRLAGMCKVIELAGVDRRVCASGLATASNPTGSS
jgi:DNA replication protein DnaC